jgi:enamine deaminase RidA (YjgF/YER057c/UK114 family)
MLKVFDCARRRRTLQFAAFPLDETARGLLSVASLLRFRESIHTLGICHMRNIVNTGLPKGKAPLELAAIANGTLYICSIPQLPDGTIESSGFVAQVERTMLNLKQSLAAAGATMDDVTQVQVFLSSKEHFPHLNVPYGKFFSEPYPVRATFIVGLIVPGADIEILAQADVSHLKK